MSAPLLGAVVAAGAALRFATIDAQSLWYDEAITARLLRMDLPGMLGAIPASESSPPLYYVLAWLWTQLLGTGEAGIRSLSALLGTTTIVVVWALGRRLGGEPAALAGAALAALHPLLHWFSQEARAYALLALLTALATLLWLRALDRPSAPRELLAWGAVAALALATHYFAVFLVAPQALWLLARAPRWRDRATALALPLATAVALAPLALDQRANAGAAFIAERPLLERVVQVPKQFLVGYDAPRELLLTALAGLVALVAVAGLARRLGVRGAAGAGLARSGVSTHSSRAAPATAATRQRRALLALVALAAAALGLALLTALAGEDHLIARNLLGVLPLLVALAGAGVAAAGPRIAVAATTAACALGALTTIAVATEPELQREDWRGAAQALRAAGGGSRVVAVAPASGAVVLRYYLPAARPAPAVPARPGPLDVILMAPNEPGARSVGAAIALASIAAGVAPQVIRRETFAVLRFAAPPGRGRPAAAGVAAALGSDAALLTLPAQS